MSQAPRRKSPTPAEFATLIERHARRALKARAQGKWEAVDSAEDSIQGLLDMLVAQDSPVALHGVIHRVFSRHADAVKAVLIGEQPAQGLSEGEMICDLVVELLHGVTEIHVDEHGHNHQLFAVSLLVPATERDWAAADAAGHARQLEGLFKAQELIHPDAQVQWFPRWVPFAGLLTISEWAVARLAAMLASGNGIPPAEAADLFEELEGLPKQPVSAGKLMETRVLIGCATMENPEPLFPRGHHLTEVLQTAESEEAADSATAEVHQLLQGMNAQVAGLLQVSEAQVATEIQGWWDDVSAIHRLMRTVHVQQQLSSLLERHGLGLTDVIASTRLVGHADEPIGMGIPLFRKNGLVYLGELLVTALPQESPDLCAEEAVSFLHSVGVGAFDGALLEEPAAPSEEGARQGGVRSAPRTLH